MDKVLFGDTATKLIAAYKGPDHSFVTRSKFWIEQLGNKPWVDITTEDIERALGVYMAAGKSKVIRSGKPPNVMRRVVSTGEPLAPATINKQLMAFPSLTKMAKERYLLPRSYQSPTKFVTKQREDSGDPYLTFAKQAGAVPLDATKASHPKEREQYKACVLATQYGTR